MRLDRRHFLEATVISTLGVLTRPARGTIWGTAAAEPPGARPALDLFDALGRDAVREIGRGYRELVPAEDDAEALRAALARDAIRRDSAVAPRTRAADLIGDDFADGRTVVVHGWVLSITEARQCALRSLLAA